MRVVERALTLVSDPIQYKQKQCFIAMYRTIQLDSLLNWKHTKETAVDPK